MTKEILERIDNFTKDRDWDKFHTGKDLALSLSLEASELLEIYQWSGNDLECLDKIERIKEELADVLVYSIMIAKNYNLNIEEIITSKLTSNEKKYPVKLVKGSSLKYTEYK